MARELTAEIARELLAYDPDTGVFTRKGGPRPGTFGRVVGAITPKGYMHGWVYDNLYMMHRVAWLYMYGVWPLEQIDHINHVRDDNRIANLRECTNSENRQNIRPAGYGVSGKLGVSPHSGKWVASISKGPVREYLGLFDDIDTAAEVYAAAKNRLHEYVVTGISELRGNDAQGG